MSLAHQVVKRWGRKRVLAGPLKHAPRPHEIEERLDQYILGQDSTKETLAVAVYNHYKRLVAFSRPASHRLKRSALRGRPVTGLNRPGGAARSVSTLGVALSSWAMLEG